jgi:hypothetical protein
MRSPRLKTLSSQQSKIILSDSFRDIQNDKHERSQFVSEKVSAILQDDLTKKGRFWRKKRWEKIKKKEERNWEGIVI